ncbi:DMT family transporter [Shewanella sp. TC10]|uniref:DMT family transporter n=1 Tax=Shewanella sp. TC10 TaxID=1419739 RepID=UPI00129E812E|nr:DMT family transporter [Shewanella sp. TC10]
MSHTRLGFIFVSVAVIFWGILPIALKLSGGFIDPITLTWFRFLVAFVVTYFLQWRFGALRQFANLAIQDWLRLSAAAILLMCNYTSFVYSLDYLSPGTAQLNFQTAPFYLAFGGALFFKERLTALQLTCFATLALGVLLFFHPSLNLSAADASQVGFGVLIVQFSVLSWTSYALLQKSLIAKLTPNNVLLFIYGLGILVMAPFSDFSHFGSMTNNEWIVIVFCAANTLIAYGCFGQSMKYWPTAQVSAMLALTPVLSFAANAMVLKLGLWPSNFSADTLDTWSLLGIVLIVGSVFVVQIWPLYQQKRAANTVKNG